MTGKNRVLLQQTLAEEVEMCGSLDRSSTVILSPPERHALSQWAETGGASLTVIPAQAGILSSPPSGFRGSRRSPGMMGSPEYPAR